MEKQELICRILVFIIAAIMIAFGSLYVNQQNSGSQYNNQMVAGQKCSCHKDQCMSDLTIPSLCTGCTLKCDYCYSVWKIGLGLLIPGIFLLFAYFMNPNQINTTTSSTTRTVTVINCSNCSGVGNIVDININWFFNQLSLCLYKKEEMLYKISLFFIFHNLGY